MEGRHDERGFGVVIDASGTITRVDLRLPGIAGSLDQPSASIGAPASSSAPRRRLRR